MVRAVGIEPTLLAERDFESRASTNSTTPALGLLRRRNQGSQLIRSLGRKTSDETGKTPVVLYRASLANSAEDECRKERRRGS
jgi:hypothetical protein